MPTELTLQALQWQIVLNYLAMTLIQWMKTTDWSFLAWVNQNNPRLTKLISIVISAATATGIHMKFTHENIGEFGIVFSGVTLIAILHFLRDVAQNYLGIKAFYRLLKPDEYDGHTKLAEINQEKPLQLSK